MVLASTAERAVDLGGCQLPVVVEDGDGALHEIVGFRQRRLIVAEVIAKDCKRQLPGGGAGISPLDPCIGIPFEGHAVVQRCAVDRYHEAVNRAFTLVSLHECVRPAVLSANISQIFHVTTRGLWPIGRITIF